MVLEALCQELGTETKCIFLIMSQHLKIIMSKNWNLDFFPKLIIIIDIIYYICCFQTLEDIYTCFPSCLECFSTFFIWLTSTYLSDLSLNITLSKRSSLMLSQSTRYSLIIPTILLHSTSQFLIMCSMIACVLSGSPAGVHEETGFLS